MATHMEPMTNGVRPTRHGMSHAEQKRKRSLGALVAGVSLATAMTLGSGLSGVLPGLDTKAQAATSRGQVSYIFVTCESGRDSRD